MDLSEKIHNKNYQIRQILATFSNLIALILGWDSGKGIRVTKIVEENKFKEVWCELESKTVFQRQSVTKHLRLTQIAHYGKSWVSIFQEIFAVMKAGC